MALGASSAARAVVAVRGLHKFAASEGLTASDVAHAVKPPTPSRRLPKALSVDDIERILDSAGGDATADGPRSLRDRAMLELLYSTGARISEAIGLDVDDIDVADRSVVLHGKGGKDRLVPVGRPALAAIDAYLVRGRPALQCRANHGAFPQCPRRSTVAPERVAGPPNGRRTGGDHGECLAAHPASFVRDASTRGRRRRPGRARAAGPCVCHDDSDLHDGVDFVAAGSLGGRAPSCEVTLNVRVRVLTCDNGVSPTGLPITNR